MGGIVCAVRGGPDSRPTIDKAIQLAKQNQLPLYFLYVVNIDFLDHTTRSRVQTITQQMEQMGEFILLTARAAANQSGIDAEGVIKHGNVTEEIGELCHEVGADYLVLGRPKFQAEDSLFSEELLAEFIERVELQTGARVVLSEADEA